MCRVASSAANLAVVERFGATAVDYRAGDFVAAVCRLTAGRKGGAGVDAAFDAIGGAHFNRSFACLASGGLLVGYGSQTMAIGSEGLASAALGLARIKLWGALSSLFGGRRAVFYSITARRLVHPEEFKADMATLFDLLRDGTIHPLVIDRLPLSAAREVHTRIDAGERLARHRAQPECVIEFTVCQQSGIGRDRGAAKLRHHASSLFSEIGFFGSERGILAPLLISTRIHRMMH